MSSYGQFWKEIKQGEDLRGKLRKVQPDQLVHKGGSEVGGAFKVGSNMYFLKCPGSDEAVLTELTGLRAYQHFTESKPQLPVTDIDYVPAELVNKFYTLTFGELGEAMPRAEQKQLAMISKKMDGSIPLGKNVLDHIRKTHSLPATIELDNGTKLPVRGLARILAVSRAIGDTDPFGTQGDNVRLIQLEDKSGPYLQAYIVDAGYAGQLLKPESKGRTRNARMFYANGANQNGPDYVDFLTLSEEEQFEFIDTLSNIAKENEDLPSILSDGGKLVLSDEHADFIFSAASRYTENAKAQLGLYTQLIQDAAALSAEVENPIVVLSGSSSV